MTTSVHEQVTSYHQQALASEAATGYWESRGLTPRTVRQFQLGWVSEPVHRDHVRYLGKPVVPYPTTSGRVVYAKVRVGWPKAKYMPLGSDFPLPSPKRHLFNAPHAMPTVRNRDVYVVEGEFDAIIATQCGLRAVSVPGVEAFYPAWAHLFADSRVHLAFDGDDAGQQAAAKLRGLLDSYQVNADIIQMPAGADLTDVFLSRGAAGVRELLRAA